MKKDVLIITGIGAVVGVIINKTSDSGIGGTLVVGNAAFAGAMVAAILYGIVLLCIAIVKTRKEKKTTDKPKNAPPS